MFRRHGLPVFEIIVTRFDQPDFFQPSPRDVVHQLIPNKLDEILAGGHELLKRRVVVQVTVIEAFHDFSVHQPVQGLEVRHFAGLRVHLTGDRDEHGIVMAMSIRVVALVVDFSIDVIGQGVRMQPMRRAEPVLTGHADFFLHRDRPVPSCLTRQLLAAFEESGWSEAVDAHFSSGTWTTTSPRTLAWQLRR